jgi:hypothetical protein
MKKLQFTVEIEFESKITQDGEIETVAANILDALRAQSDSGPGLAPEESDTFPLNIKVSNSVVNTTLEHDFMKHITEGRINH